MDPKHGWQLLYFEIFYYFFTFGFAIFIFLYYTFFFGFVLIFFPVMVKMPVGDKCRDFYVEKHYYSFCFYINGLLICIKCLLMLNRTKEYITLYIIDLS